jgi:2-keto-4-pentenoate hydratase/2-oxohepta-3-ene-1,7-dioic acid hydratase in catechol pathway
MKLVSFVKADGEASYGVISGEGVVDLASRLEGAPTLCKCLQEGALVGASALAVEPPDVLLTDIVFAPVIPHPNKIICIGLNYAEHARETGRTATEKPALFPRFSGCQVGHLQPMIRPAVSEEFDYEGELAVIIGAEGRHIKPENALDHVAGYACYNDGSIRDWQRHTSQFMAGKNFVGTGSFGPWMVTADEIPDPSKLTLETRLNGKVVQHSGTDQMITPVPELIAYISTILPLLPGDVIVTGTPAGVGMKRTPPLWLKPGDIVEVEISEIGVLRNTIIAE